MNYEHEKTRSHQSLLSSDNLPPIVVIVIIIIITWSKCHRIWLNQVALQSGQARHWAGQGRISYDLTMCTWTVFTLELPLIWWSELEASYDLRKCTWTVLTLELSMIWQSVKYSFDIGQFWLLSFTPGGDVGGPLPNGHATPQTAG